MKRIWLFTVIWLLLSLVGPARGQSTGSAIAWNMDQLLVEIYTQPHHSQQLSRSLPFVAAQLSSGTTDEWVGILFRQVNGDQFWVYELYDANAQKVIKRISLNEMLGLVQDRGCKIVLDEQIDREHIVTEYEIQVSEYHFLMKRFISLLTDVNVAGGRRLIISFEMENLGGGTTDVRFSMRHLNDDLARKYDSNTLFTLNRSRNTDSNDLVDWPIMVQVYEPTPVSLELEGPQQGKDAMTVSTITWAAKPIERRIAKGRVEVGRLHIAFTTLDATFTHEQAENLAGYLTNAQPTPQLSVDIIPDKWEVVPGDIISYSIKCVHTGTGKSVGGAIIDPIPSGVHYLAESAFGSGSLIQYSTDGGATYESTLSSAQEVTHIRWEIQETLEPGKMLQMGFQVQVE